MLNMFSSSALPALEQTAVFAQRRHEVLAGNLANLDTPNYRSRDLSVEAFQEALSDSIQRAQSPSPGQMSPGQMSPGRMSPGHMSPGRMSPGQMGSVEPEFAAGPRAAMEQVVFHDGSDVGMENQVTQIAKNQHMHNLAIALMRNQFGVLQSAISERV